MEEGKNFSVFGDDGIRKMNTICFHCREEDVNCTFLKKCSGCKLVYFCNEECLQKSWSLHKPWCRSPPQSRKEYGIGALHFLDYQDQSAKRLILENKKNNKGKTSLTRN